MSRRAATWRTAACVAAVLVAGSSATSSAAPRKRPPRPTVLLPASVTGDAAAGANLVAALTALLERWGKEPDPAWLVVEALKKHGHVDPATAAPACAGVNTCLSSVGRTARVRFWIVPEVEVGETLHARIRVVRVGATGDERGIESSGATVEALIAGLEAQHDALISKAPVPESEDLPDLELEALPDLVPPTTPAADATPDAGTSDTPVAAASPRPAGAGDGSMDLIALPKTALTPPPPHVAAPIPAETRWLRLLGFSGAGVGLGAVGAGGFLGWRSQTLRADIRPKTHSQIEATSQLNRAKGSATLANIMYGVGALLVIAGGGLVALDAVSGDGSESGAPQP